VDWHVWPEGAGKAEGRLSESGSAILCQYDPAGTAHEMDRQYDCTPHRSVNKDENKKEGEPVRLILFLCEGRRLPSIRMPIRCVFPKAKPALLACFTGIR
jgi:hypothetical protein